MLNVLVAELESFHIIRHFFRNNKKGNNVELKEKNFNKGIK